MWIDYYTSSISYIVSGPAVKRDGISIFNYSQEFVYFYFNNLNILCIYKIQELPFWYSKKKKKHLHTSCPFPCSEWKTLFQLDVSTSHIAARVSMNALKALFSGRVISRNGDIPRPPLHCPDLTTCDLFFTTVGTLNQKCLRTIFCREPPNPSNNVYSGRD